MNSILDIHVQRERGQAVTLAPRLPSMFESGSNLQETAPVFEAPVRATPAADAPPAPMEAPRRTPPPPIEPTPELRRAAPPVPAPVAVPKATAQTVQQSLVPPARHEQPLPVHVPGPQVIRFERETVLAVPAPVRSEPAPVAQPPRRAPAVVPPLPAAQPSVAAAIPAPPPVAPRLAVRRASEPLAARASTSQVLPAPQALRVPASRRESAPPAPIARAPDVHITIGRIEVRATTAAPSRTARDNGAAAPMSLDQYLNQRNRKGNT